MFSKTNCFLFCRIELWHTLNVAIVVIIPISVCYYLELRNAIKSCLGVQFQLTKVQYVVWTLQTINNFAW
jgi:hypothetical protein